MATLASIPEVPSRKSLQSQHQQASSAVDFRRVRPRSRVVIISKRPSRVQRQPRCSVASTETANDENHLRVPEASRHFKNPKTTGPPDSPSHRLPRPQVEDEAVSPLNSSRGSSLSLSEPSVELENFPKPPGRADGWPFPDEPHLNEHKHSAANSYVSASYAKSPPESTYEKNNKVPGVPSDKTTTAKYTPQVSSDTIPSNETQRGGSVNSKNVEAVSRNVVKKLRPFSRSKRKHVRQAHRKISSGSRTSSQREALEYFTGELQRYAEKVGAVGKIPVFASTPSKTPPSFRTISALLPYRPEFRAVDLAVTSRDQAEGLPIRKRNKIQSQRHKQRQNRDDAQHSHVSQVDRKQESPLDQSTIIDFVDSTDIENWRHALIDEVPVVPTRKHGTVGSKSTALSRCLPCFTGYRGYSPSSGSTQILFDARGHLANLAPAAPPRSSSKRANVGLRDENRNRAAHTPTAPELQVQKLPNNSRDTSSRPPVESKDIVPEAEPKRSKGLRRRSMTLGQIQISPEARKPKRTSKQQHHRSPEAAPLSSIPQTSSNQDLHRFAGRQYERRPSHAASKGPIQKPHSIGQSRSLPNISAHSHHRVSATPRPSFWSRHPIEKENVPFGKVKPATKEIARHDLSPHPTSVPKPRVKAVRKASSKVTRKSPQSRNEFRLYSTSRKVSDREVLRGLQVAAAAACNKVIHKDVQEKSGINIRQFLANLIEFESVATSPDATWEQRARKSRWQMKKLKQRARNLQEMKRRSELLA